MNLMQNSSHLLFAEIFVRQNCVRWGSNLPNFDVFLPRREEEEKKLLPVAFVRFTCLDVWGQPQPPPPQPQPQQPQFNRD